MSLYPSCLIRVSLVVGNFASSFKTACSDRSPVYFVIFGNFSVSLYLLHLAASLYIFTLWKLAVTLLYFFFFVFRSVSRSSWSENWYMLS